eukprot:scaffold486_cov254-Pinguiococcus_pyrenoidosus.AAC.14
MDSHMLLEIRRVFAAADQNGNGRISGAELGGLMTQCERALPKIQPARSSDELPNSVTEFPGLHAVRVSAARSSARCAKGSQVSCEMHV